MWEINNSLQILSFFRSLVLGILLCVFYDIIKSFRLTFNFSTIAIFLQDIIYSVIAAFATFLFLLSVTNGEMRGYVIVGILAGFILSRVTLSRILCKFLKIIYGGIKRLFGAVSKGFYLSFDLLTEKMLKIFKKTLKSVKKLLKTSKDLLYTKTEKSELGVVSMKRKPKKQKKQKSILLRVFILFVCGYFAVTLGSLWGKLNDSVKELEDLKAQLQAEENEVEELRAILNADSDTPLIEKAARERLGYIYSDEQVFVDISGD